MHQCIFFGPKCNIKFVSNIQLFQRNKSVALSNEALIKSGAKLCRSVSYRNPPVWDFFAEEKQLINHSKCNNYGKFQIQLWLIVQYKMQSHYTSLYAKRQIKFTSFRCCKPVLRLRGTPFSYNPLKLRQH